MKQIFLIALCVGLAGCAGSSKHTGSNGTSSAKETQTKPTGVRVSGEGRFGVVYGS